MSGSHSRSKGVRGEREVADLFEVSGWSVRGLEGQGDWLAIKADGSVWHLECKRQERLQLGRWIAQTTDEAPEGAVPVLCFRRNRERWFAVIPLEDLLNL